MKAGEEMKKVKLQNRLQQILITLLDLNDWCTSSSLAMLLNVTDRTIRNDMSELTAILSDFQIYVTSERSKGYLLDNENKIKVKKYIKSGQIEMNKINEEMHIEILIYLIENNKPMNLDELSDEFYISKSTLEEKIKKIKSLLFTFNGNVCLTRKKNVVQLEGDEKSLRQLFNFLITDNDHSQISLDLKCYSNTFDYEEMLEVQQIAIDETNKNEVKISDIGLVAIVIHIMISISRIRSHMELRSSYINERNKAVSEKSVEEKIAEGICTQISKSFEIEFNQYEVEAIAYYISFRRFFSTDVSNDVDLGTNQMLSQEVKSVLELIKETFLIDMTNDQELINGLVNHFGTLMQRFNLQVRYQNPILEEFKDKYPFIFELAVFARKRFAEMLNIELNEDEVGYVAIHFGAAIEKLKFSTEKKKINLSLISHLNYPESQLLISKLRSSLGNFANIYGPFSIFHSEDAWDCDPKMILTTTSLELDQSKAVVMKINSILTKKELLEVEKQVIKIVDEKMKLGYSDFFRKEEFFSDLDLSSKEEVIHILSKSLCEHKIVNDKFEKLVLARENFSTTVLMNLIALPHPMEVSSYETVISVALLKKPIIWSKRKVQVVFLMAVAQDEQHYLSMFFELIAELSEDINFVQKMLKAKKFNEFIELINNYERVNYGK